jgi:hypothetical protein
VNCGGDGQELYGSDIKHNTIIKMELRHSVKRRGLNHDWYFGNKRIAEVSMSQTQFSELITSMNMGDGVPVTLNFTEQDGSIESPKFESKLEIHEEEFKDMTKRVSEELADLEATMKEILSGSGTVKKEDRNKMLAKVAKVAQDLTSNMPYVENCFRESMDKTVTDAKGTIEAWYQHRVTTAGLEALALEDGVIPPKLIEDDK